MHSFLHITKIVHCLQLHLGMICKSKGTNGSTLNYTTDDVIEAIAEVIGECKFIEIAEKIRQHGESIMEKAKDICQEKMQQNSVS